MAQNYDPKQVACTWRGLDVHVGIASGTAIVATHGGGEKSLNTGGDGGVTVMHGVRVDGTITITYRGGAPILSKLSDLANDDKVRTDGFANFGKFYIKDFSGNTEASAPEAILENAADIELGDEENDVTVVWLCPFIKIENKGAKEIRATTTTIPPI